MQKLIYYLARFIIPSLVKPFIRDINGLNNIPKKGRIILAANHSSLLDTLIIPSIVKTRVGRSMYYIGKKELFKGWLNRLFFNSINVIPIDREAGGKKALKNVLMILKKGEVIGIFPEGTRTREGNLNKGKTGVARLAVWSRTRVIPVALNDSYKVWPKGRFFPRFRRMDINIGKPMDFKKYYSRDNPENLRKITDNIMKEIAKLLGKEYNC